MSPHKRKFVHYPDERLWHAVHPESKKLAKESFCWDPRDEVMSRCGRGFSFRADGCTVMKEDRAQLTDRLPRGAKLCGNCRRR